MTTISSLAHCLFEFSFSYSNKSNDNLDLNIFLIEYLLCVSIDNGNHSLTNLEQKVPV